MDVTVGVHAPRVAAPSANTESDPATVFVDLGRVRLRSCAAVELGASAETSKLFNAFKISVADVSAAVAPGPWDPTAAWSASTFTDAAPLIPAFGANATILQALAPVPGHAETEMTLDAGALRVAVSPAKVRQLDAVVAQLARNDEGDAAMTEAETTSVDGSDAFGDVGSDAPGDSTPAMALWMSFGRLRWVPCRARIAADGRRVEVLRARRKLGRRGVAALEKHLVPPMPLLAGGALALSEKAAAGQRRVVVACPDADAVAAATRAVASPMHATKRATGPPPPPRASRSARRDQSRASIPNRRTGSAVERRGERRGARRETRGRRGCGRRRAGRRRSIGA